MRLPSRTWDSGDIQGHGRCCRHVIGCQCVSNGPNLSLRSGSTSFLTRVSMVRERCNPGSFFHPLALDLDQDTLPTPYRRGRVTCVCMCSLACPLPVDRKNPPRLHRETYLFFFKNPTRKRPPHRDASILARSMRTNAASITTSQIWGSYRMACMGRKKP